MLSFEEKYKAILSKDSSCEGVFYMAVKTTGIFCRPVCTARKPKAKKVKFFIQQKRRYSMVSDLAKYVNLWNWQIKPLVL